MLVEHHMDLVMSVCDDIVVLDFGRVIATGSPAEVRDDPAVLAAYLGDARRRRRGGLTCSRSASSRRRYGAVRALRDVTFTAPRAR